MMKRQFDEITSDSEYSHETSDSDSDSINTNIEVKDKNINSVRNKQFQCDKCQRVYHKKSRLDSHYRSHTGERPYICTYENCNKDFIRCDHLKRHILTNHSTITPNYKCIYSSCNKSFYSNIHLNRHLSTHNKILQFLCKYCSQSHSKKTLLRQHLLDAHNIAEFQCTIDDCKRYFPSKSKLIRHLENHNKHRITCTVNDCSIVLSNKQDFDKHMKLCHNNINSTIYCQTITTNDITDEKAEKSFKCSYEGCDRVYNYNKNLLAHIRSVHTLVNAYRCNEDDCGQVFGFKHSLTRHITNIHVNNKNKRVVIPKDKNIRDGLVQEYMNQLI